MQSTLHKNNKEKRRGNILVSTPTAASKLKEVIFSLCENHLPIEKNNTSTIRIKSPKHFYPSQRTQIQNNYGGPPGSSETSFLAKDFKKVKCFCTADFTCKS